MPNPAPSPAATTAADPSATTGDRRKRVPSTVTVKEILNWLAALQTKRTNYDSKKHGKRETKPLSRQTRKHALNLLRRFFVWAIEQEHAMSNPCIGLQVARRDGDEGEGYQEGWYLDATDQARVLQILKDNPERWIVAFAIGTGLRQREQWCLHLEDVQVDGDDPHVLVRFGSWDAKKKRYRPPKGPPHVRVVPGLRLVRSALAFEDVRMVLGHSSVKVTERYAHLVSERRAGRRERRTSRLGKPSRRRHDRFCGAQKAEGYQWRARQDSNLRPAA